MRFIAYLLRILLITIACGILLWGVGLGLFVARIPWNGTPSDEKTDAIIVLTGGAGRLDYALDLLIAGKGRKLFISGVDSDIPLKDLFRENVHKKLLSSMKDRFIDIGTVARDTKGNALETAEWMEMQHYSSLRLVTANYHIPRSLFEFRKLMPQMRIIPDPVFPAPFDSMAWKRDPQALALVITEYHKYCATRLHAVFL